MPGTDAIKLLKKDHDEVRGLLKKLTDTTKNAVQTRRKLLEQVANEIAAHAKVEEEIFYPACRNAARNEKERQLLAEAREEHRAVEDLVLPDLKKTEPGTVEFGGRAKVLKELVEHHADEEEDELFKFARKVLSKEKLEQLGEQMAARKEELLAATA